MNKRVLLGAIIGFTFLNLNAQQDEDVKKAAAAGTGISNVVDTGWLTGGFVGLNLSNTTLNNWAGGGVNSTTAVGNASLFAIYRPESMKSIWETYLDMVLGYMRNGKAKIDDPSSPYNGRTNPFLKNEDKLVFTTKYGRALHPKLFASTLASLNTQMLPGYAKEDLFMQNYPISDFMAQGFGYWSLGFDYKPTSSLSVYFSPATVKYTAVINQRLADLGAYGVKPAEYDYSDTIGGKAPVKTKNGEQMRLEVGCYVNIFFKKEIVKNVDFQTRLELFNNYKNLGREVDVNWQTTINLKVNKFLSVSIVNQVLYDFDIDTNPTKPEKQVAWQMKNFAGIGLSYAFGDTLKK